MPSTPSNALNISSAGIVKFDGTATFAADTVTNHNVLVGGTSNSITSVAPSATSGVPVISQGASADPTFGTAVVAGGGTGAVSFNTTGVVISGATTTTALASVTLGDGQLAIGSSSGNPAAAALSAGVGITITNAANSITVAATGAGLTWSETSGSFSAAAGHGYILTGASTPTLPTSPALGTTIGFICNTGSTVTVTAGGTNVIRVGSTVSAGGGTCASSTQGNSIMLVYGTTNTQWCSFSAPEGTWTVT